jgi:hypothetical protein
MWGQVLIPGMGLLPLEEAIARLAPPLSREEEIQLQSLSSVAGGALGGLRA